MKTKFVPFLAFIGLLILTLPVVNESINTDIPGWHTQLNRPIFPWRLTITIGLILLIIGKWLFNNKTGYINWILFAINVGVTLTSIIYLKFPTIFLDYNLSNQIKLIKLVELSVSLIPLVIVIFFIGQVLLIISIIRTINKTKLA